ncbi:MAG: hypothetical protein WC477_06140 [Patescibacteria group bacterium]
MAEQINSVVDNLANKLGIAAEKLLPVMIYQARIDGIESLILWSTSLLVMIICVALMIRAIIKSKDEVCWDTQEYIRFWVPGTIGFIFLWVFIFNFHWITALYNPEWYALKLILNALGGDI